MVYKLGMFTLLVIACAKQKPGGLGGMTGPQVERFNTVSAQWNDARVAYQKAFAGGEPSGRAGIMARHLKNSNCSITTPARRPLSARSPYVSTAAVSGNSCAIDVTEKRVLARPSSGAMYSINHVYEVKDRVYQKLNPLKTYRLQGAVTTDKFASGTETHGGYKLALVTSTAKHDTNLDGSVEIYENSQGGALKFGLDFKDFAMNAEAAWARSMGKPKTNYSIQGTKVDRSTFEAALAPFGVPEMVNQVQEMSSGL